MDLYGLQPTNAHTDHADASGPSWPLPEENSRYSVLHSGPEPLLSTDPSPHSNYTANTSPLLYLTTNSTSTQPSNMSFPYSVTSINSRRSRKNVLYPRRVHPLLVPATSEKPVSPDPLIWQVRFLCTTLLPCSETRLVPAGKVLLQSLGLHGDFSQRVPARTDEETRCCAELFIALTHEVLFKDAVSAGELEGPCNLLHTTFKDILFKLEAFSLPATRKSNEAGLKAPSTGALARERISGVLCALYPVMDAFEEALASLKPPAAKDGAFGDHFRIALMGLSVSTGLTLGQYRKKLGQNLAQTQSPLSSLSGQHEESFPRPKSKTPVIRPRRGAARSIFTIEEGSEGEGSSANGHTRSHIAQSHSTRCRSDSNLKRSLPRRILRRLIRYSTRNKTITEV